MTTTALNKYTEPTPWAQRFIKALPHSLAQRARAEWLKIANRPSDNPNWTGTQFDDCECQADLFIRNFARPFKQKWTMPLDSTATDDDICQLAKKIADDNRQYWQTVLIKAQYDQQILQYQPLEATLTAQAIKYQKLHQMANNSSKQGVAVADLLDDPNMTVDGIAARLCDEHFCRRRLRRTFNRVREEILRNHFGSVSKRKNLYASQEAVNTRRSQRSRNKALLEALKIINELGEEYKLAEIVAKTNANPAIRRAELMVRIAGFETIARDLNHAGEFITITCPSAYHAIHHQSGQPNPKFNQTTPRDATLYLNKTWARIRAALKDNDINIYGFRVAEPHHDGTPHWHGLFFMPKNQVPLFRQIVAKYACRQDHQELGLKYHLTAKARRQAAKQIQAQQKTWRTPQTLAVIEQSLLLEADYWQNAQASHYHNIKARVDFTPINWAKGTAAGYIAKYIAKNIDGKNSLDQSVGVDFESSHAENLTQTAERVDAWAAIWGIRQFQQIGGAPVTIWRELRRLELTDAEREEQTDLMRAANAADNGDWAKFTTIMGGINCPRDMRPVTLYKEAIAETNRYGEARPEIVRGVIEIATGQYKIGHIHQWVITQQGGKAAPWTCVNNCRKTKSVPEIAAAGLQVHYDWEAVYIRDWLRRNNQDPTIDIDRNRAHFRQQIQQEFNQSKQHRFTADQIQTMITDAQQAAEAQRIQSEHQHLIQTYKAKLHRLAAPAKRGILSPEPIIDLTPYKISQRPDRSHKTKEANTPDNQIQRLRTQRQAILERMVQQNQN